MFAAPIETPFVKMSSVTTAGSPSRRYVIVTRRVDRFWVIVTLSSTTSGTPAPTPHPRSIEPPNTKIRFMFPFLSSWWFLPDDQVQTTGASRIQYAGEAPGHRPDARIERSAR